MELNDNGRAFYRFGKSIQTEYSHLKKELKALSGFREKPCVWARPTISAFI